MADEALELVDNTLAAAAYPSSSEKYFGANLVQISSVRTFYLSRKHH
jgi:hypothetical protein